MKFLDLNGLNHFWTKIKASFGTAIVDNSQGARIPFVTNHQIVDANSTSYGVNAYDWFKKASKGGILEIINTITEGHDILCFDNKSYLYKMQVASDGSSLTKIERFPIQYNNYVRLIKMDDNKLVVAEFVENK